MKKIWAGLAAALCLLLLAGCSTRQTEALAPKQTATLYLHGYGGGASSTNFLIAHAVHAQGATKVLTAKVSPKGRVTLHGRWRVGARHPLVQVVFENSRARSLKTSARWLEKVVLALKNQYHMHRFNIVAHSVGNLAALQFALTDAKKAGMPKLEKWASLAGNFDGIVGYTEKANANSLRGSGEPKILLPEYRQFKAQRRHFPSNIAVWNGYGDLNNGSNSDSRVSLVSALSLGYLVRAKAQSYQTQAFIGKNAQHSRLHENSKVAAAIEKFLW